MLSLRIALHPRLAPEFARLPHPADPFVTHTHPYDQLTRPNPPSAYSAANRGIIQCHTVQHAPPSSSTIYVPAAGLRRTAHKSAIVGTTIPAFAADAAAITVAPSAERQPTMRADALKDPRKVTTPLSSSAWHSVLDSCSLLPEFLDVVEGLSSGFRTGVTSKLSQNFIPDNHRSARQNQAAVSQHILNKLRLLRYSGPYNIMELQQAIGFFRTAPLGVVPKSDSKKFRIIQDLSFPRNDPCQYSVNSEITSDDFPCKWGTFAQCYFLVAKAPPGTQAAQFDVDAATRTSQYYLPNKITSVFPGTITYMWTIAPPSAPHRLVASSDVLPMLLLPSSKNSVPSKFSNGWTILYSSAILPTPRPLINTATIPS